MLLLWMGISLSHSSKRISNCYSLVVLTSAEHKQYCQMLQCLLRIICSHSADCIGIPGRENIIDPIFMCLDFAELRSS